MTALEKINAINAKITNSKPRSAWSKGVKVYALEIIEEMQEAASRGWIDAEDICNRRMMERAMLNGAEDWQQYSEGGCALIYDQDIAERLCNRTELKRTNNGRRNPNRNENWIDVQSRALFQASRIVLDAAFCEV